MKTLDTLCVLEDEKVRKLSERPIGELEKVTLAYIDGGMVRIVPVMSGDCVRYRKDGKLTRVRIEHYNPLFRPRYDLMSCTEINVLDNLELSFIGLSKHEGTPAQHWHTIPKEVKNEDIFVLPFSFYEIVERELQEDRRYRAMNRRERFRAKIF